MKDLEDIEARDSNQVKKKPVRFRRVGLPRRGAPVRRRCWGRARSSGAYKDAAAFAVVAAVYFRRTSLKNSFKS